MPKVERAEPDVFKHQADATLTQASAVSGTKYTVLDTTKNVRIISIAALDDWSVDTTLLEVHVTIDGESFVWQVDPTDNTWYSVRDIDAGATNLLQTLNAASSTNQAFILEGKSVKVEVETTGGTSVSLQCRVKYAKIP